MFEDLHTSQERDNPRDIDAFGKYLMFTTDDASFPVQDEVLFWNIRRIYNLYNDSKIPSLFIKMKEMEEDFEEEKFMEHKQRLSKDKILYNERNRRQRRTRLIREMQREHMRVKDAIPKYAGSKE